MSQEVWRARARELLERLGAEGPPLDVEAIVRALGLTVRSVSRGRGFDGQLLRQRMQIEVEQSAHRHRRRFTLAHELGHYVLNHSPVMCASDDRATYDPKRINESQANTFASELLMPEQWVRAHWPGVKNISAMAVLFDVSEQAMFYKLENLGLLGLEPRI